MPLRTSATPQPVQKEREKTLKAFTLPVMLLLSFFFWSLIISTCLYDVSIQPGRCFINVLYEKRENEAGLSVRDEKNWRKNMNLKNDVPVVI